VTAWIVRQPSRDVRWVSFLSRSGSRRFGAWTNLEDLRHRDVPDEWEEYEQRSFVKREKTKRRSDWKSAC